MTCSPGFFLLFLFFYIIFYENYIVSRPIFVLCCHNMLVAIFYLFFGYHIFLLKAVMTHFLSLFSPFSSLYCRSVIPPLYVCLNLFFLLAPEPRVHNFIWLFQIYILLLTLVSKILIKVIMITITPLLVLSPELISLLLLLLLLLQLLLLMRIRSSINNARMT